MEDAQYRKMKSEIQSIRRELESLEQHLDKAFIVSASEPPKVVSYPSFALYERQGKGAVFEKALQQSGYLSLNEWRRASFVLADHDQRQDMLQILRANKPFFLYPHSSRSMVMWDGILPPASSVKCNFVFWEGHKKVMQIYGYPRPIETTGWTYCKIEPFRASKEMKRVLFAPIHPNRSADSRGNKLARVDLDLNRRAFEILNRIEGIDLTVRMYGSWADNGLLVSNVKTSLSDLSIEGSLTELKKGYDIVVAHQTFAHIAIAKGIPTVMFGEDTVPHSVNTKAKNWEHYKHFLMFPLDILVGNPMEVMERACGGDEDIRRWKDDFIGEAFDPQRFTKKIEAYL